MKKNQATDIQIHTLQEPAEMDAFFRLNAIVFRSSEDPALVTAKRRRFLTQDPDFHLHQIRGVFIGATCVGGYALLERNICLGPARLRIGCINGVVTHPDYRHQGIASALMYDAIHNTEDLHYPLLLLHGIADFYQQFGYVDVLEDIPRHVITQKHLPELAPDIYTVRIATRNDIPALLDCYQRHYGSYLGSFAPTRTLQRQEHLLFNWFEATDSQTLVALSPQQHLDGYLVLSWKRHRLYTYEAATDTWEATLALLHAHQQMLDKEPEPIQELAWLLPPTDPTFYFLAQHLPIRSELHSVPNGGWMARPVHLPTLLQSLLSLWQEYWQNRSRLLEWIGTFALTIDTYTIFLYVTPTTITLVDMPSSSLFYAKFSSSVFTQLIFGSRPISWAMLQPEQHFSTELIPILTILFPARQAWIAGSDAF